MSSSAPDPAARAQQALTPIRPNRLASNEDASRQPLEAAQLAADKRRVEVSEDAPGKGLAHLVLTLVKLIHDLLEKQAVGRMERGTLTDDEVERVGRTLMKQAEELERLCEVFGLELDDLHLDLGTIQHPET